MDKTSDVLNLLCHETNQNDIGLHLHYFQRQIKSFIKLTAKVQKDSRRTHFSFPQRKIMHKISNHYQESKIVELNEFCIVKS